MKRILYAKRSARCVLTFVLLIAVSYADSSLRKKLTFYIPRQRYAYSQSHLSHYQAEHHQGAALKDYTL